MQREQRDVSRNARGLEREHHAETGRETPWTSVGWDGCSRKHVRGAEVAPQRRRMKGSSDAGAGAAGFGSVRAGSRRVGLRGGSGVLVVAAVADAPAETTALTVGSGGAAGNVVGITVGPDA